MERGTFVYYFGNLMQSIIDLLRYEFVVYGYHISIWGMFIFLWVASLLLSFIWKALGNHQGG